MMKEHTSPLEVDIIKLPQTATIIDRYLFCQPYIQGKKVLDAGCGAGISTMMLHALGARHVMGVDLNYDAIQEASTHFGQGPHYQFYNSAINSAPIEENSFDTIVCLEVIEHLPIDILEETFRTFKRIIKPGGHIIMSTPNFKGDVVPDKHQWGWDWKKIRRMVKRNFEGHDVKTYGILELTHSLKIGDKEYKHTASYLVEDTEIEKSEDIPIVQVGHRVVFFIIEVK